MITQMTRAEYERLYGVKPVFSATSTLEDETPAPIRMTRAEYNEIYYPTQTKQDGLGSQLANRAKDVGDALWADKPSDLAPGRTALRIGGAITGAAADVIGAALSPAIGKLVDTVSNIPAVQKFAMKRGTSKALDVANMATEVSQEEWKKFEEKNPVIAQDIRDVTNIASFIPVGKGAQVAGKGVAKATEGLVPKVAKQLDERSVKNVVDEIAKIEDKYAGTRKANLYSKDVDASRRRIAESNVLDGAVDTDGVIRTKTPGGVIDQYRAQTIDGLEDIVRKGLKESKETIPVTMVRQALVREVGKSGLEGADLVTALKKIDKELEGLNVRTKGSSIVDLSYLHDNKIATTKNINYLTPPEKSTYRKAVARAYKMLVEENSTKVDVKGINKELSMYLDDIKRLERLDGARAEGGRLGKYTASVAGTLIGGAAGSVGGGVGAAVGGVLGGEAAAALKGIGMSRTFKGGGKGLPKSAVLERARLSIPDKAIKAKAGVPKTKEITKLEKDIAKNVADQKKAIAKGDFTLVAALKEVYIALVEELKKAIKYLNENASVGMSIRKTVTPESVAKRADDADMGVLDYVIRDYDNAILDPNVNRTLSDMGLGKATRDERIRFAKDVFDEQAGVGGKVTIKTDPLVEEARKYKSAEEFVKAQGTPVYHATDSVTFDPANFDVTKATKGEQYFNPLGEGLYASSNKDFVRRFGANTINLVLPKTAKIKNVSIDSWKKDFDSISRRAIKNLGIKYDDLTLNERVEIKRLVPNIPIESANNLEVILRDVAERLGKDGSVQNAIQRSVMEQYKKYNVIKYLDTDYAVGADEIIVKNPSILKTRSQLTDIWEKANKTDPLVEEAKKYKSAEEFVKAQGTPVYHGGGKQFGSVDEIDFEQGFYTLRRTQSDIKSNLEKVKNPPLPWVTNKDIEKYLSKTELEEYNKLTDLPNNKITPKEDARWTELSNTAAKRKLEAEGSSINEADWMSEPARAFGDKVTELVVDFKKPLVVDAKGKTWLEVSDGEYSDYTMSLIQKAKKSGNDGVIIKNIEEGFSGKASSGITAGLVDDYIALTPDSIKTKSQLTDIWKKANKTDPLVEEARKYKSAEEFVDSNSKVYRTSDTPFDPLKNKGTGAFVSPSETYAGSFGEGGKRPIQELYISPKAKWLDYKDIPDKFKNFDGKDIEKLQSELADYAKSKGYDVIGGEPKFEYGKGYENQVVNPGILKTKSQLTDIWNKANKADPLVEEPRKYKSAEEYIKSKKSKDFWKKRNEEKAKRKLPTKSNNLYHTTPAENLDSIIKDGLVIGKKPRFEGVSSSKKISLSANEDAANYYGGNSDIMIRTKTGYIPQNLESDLLAGGDGVYTTTKNIPPNMLQVKVGGKWYDLTDKQLTDIWKTANRKGGATDK